MQLLPCTMTQWIESKPIFRRLAIQQYLDHSNRGFGSWRAGCRVPFDSLANRARLLNPAISFQLETPSLFGGFLLVKRQEKILQVCCFRRMFHGCQLEQNSASSSEKNYFCVSSWTLWCLAPSGGLSLVRIYRELREDRDFQDQTRFT